MKIFDRDRTRVVARAKEAGVNIILNVGLDLKSSTASVEMAGHYPGIVAAAGFHPHEASRMRDDDLRILRELALDPAVVAIGEIGLDFYRNRSPRETQVGAFRRQLEMATELDLPVIIHCRKAQAEVIAILKEWVSQRNPNSRAPGVIHCFDGDTEDARRYLNMGFYLSFTAAITYPSAHHLVEVISSIPQNRMLVETDCPFLPPQGQRGSRNEPAYVTHTAKCLAQILRTSGELVRQFTTQNAIRLFNLSP